MYKRQVTNYGSFHFEIQGHRAHHIHAKDKLREAEQYRTINFEQSGLAALADDKNAVDAGQGDCHDIDQDDRKGDEYGENKHGEHYADKKQKDIRWDLNQLDDHTVSYTHLEDKPSPTIRYKE